MTGSVDGLIWLARVGVYLGLFAGVGGVFFDAWIARAPSGVTLIVAALAIGSVSADGIARACRGSICWICRWRPADAGALESRARRPAWGRR